MQDKKNFYEEYPAGSHPFSDAPQSAVTVVVHLDRLRQNFRRILSRCGVPVMPVLKSDAYGHGATACAKALENETQLLGVGTVAEGIKLRKAGIRAPVLAMMGIVCPQDATAAIHYGIIPLVGEAETLRLIATQTRQGTPASVALKFDTGMSRLGFSLSDIPSLAHALEGMPDVRPLFALSHLAVADEKDGGGFTALQAEEFAAVMASLRQYWPHMRFSLANSAAALSCPHTRHDFVRAGLALYGYDPLDEKGAGDGEDAFRPVMEAWAPVLQIRTIEAGRSVSYGRKFRALRKTRLAIIAAGYANGVLRSLSGKGHVGLAGGRAPIVGRVCMQLCMADISGLPEVRIGDPAFLLGGASPVGADELARAAGTIPYELLCLLGAVNQRRYLA